MFQNLFLIYRCTFERSILKKQIYLCSLLVFLVYFYGIGFDKGGKFNNPTVMSLLFFITNFKSYGSKILSKG